VVLAELAQLQIAVVVVVALVRHTAQAALVALEMQTPLVVAVEDLVVLVALAQPLEGAAAEVFLPVAMAQIMLLVEVAAVLVLGVEMALLIMVGMVDQALARDKVLVRLQRIQL
jgi:hypothetical protein